ncbi:DUF2946 domain-containing protein [Erwinia mallotivora]|uniref:DUF2946 domain-containing protein n=1 Tax=Erwinia mallotivora TaxID=69222 RepID=UPI001F37C9A7|nr:DUF2946 domain-containing protein [Erwinia mallotivora]
MLQSRSFCADEDLQDLSLFALHRSPNRYAAWAGLLAMLLIFIAPVISKSLAMTPARHMAMMMNMPGMAMHDMPGMTTDDDAMAAGDTQKASHPPLSVMDDSACGYCLLLVHLPLALTSLPPLWSVLQAASLHAVPLFSPVIRRFIPTFFRPRAPPASSRVI